MKRNFIVMIAGVSIGLISLIGIPTYGRGGGGHGGGGAGFSGGGHAGFSGGAHFSGAGHGYGGAGMSRAGGSYGARNYSPGISPGRYGNYGQHHYVPRSSGGGHVYGPGARSQSTTASRQFAVSPKYSGSYYVPRTQSRSGFVQKPGIQQRAGNARERAGVPNRAWSRQNAGNRQQLNRETKDRLRNWQGRAPGYADAKRHHDEQWRYHHGHDWWRHHCDAIVFVGGGFWGWYDGWWYPAWGYDPYYSYYDYNGPIYGYDGLQPDEIISNVQTALQQLGYFPYAIDGVFGPLTQNAVANYQRDYQLSVTGAIDPPTVRSLGLGG